MLKQPSRLGNGSGALAMVALYKLKSAQALDKQLLQAGINWVMLITVSCSYQFRGLCDIYSTQSGHAFTGGMRA